jgi:hypothetical protein
LSTFFRSAWTTGSTYLTEAGTALLGSFGSTREAYHGAARRRPRAPNLRDANLRRSPSPASRARRRRPSSSRLPTP